LCKKIPLLVHIEWIMQAMSVTCVRRLMFLSGDSSKQCRHALDFCFWNSVLCVLHSVMMETVLIHINNVSRVASLSKNYKIKKRMLIILRIMGKHTAYTWCGQNAASWMWNKMEDFKLSVSCDWYSFIK
jgi:hypothetical protein